MDDTPPLKPLGLCIEDAVKVSGVSRSGLYRAAAKGELVFRKNGGRIIVDYSSLEQMLARLPVATIRVAV